ncbi:hypothetical protein NPX13_g5739 [Xylaria arbuscula]|uniref:Bromodomain associated domain-containing protein n=1 Tax=Xylaria arbuscula TaxID=114810 RepID=A0A9W8NDG5_9PEZI|nr:hypothetical protein NPX13_g5739 [Xylaria arbuscula]
MSDNESDKNSDSTKMSVDSSSRKRASAELEDADRQSSSKRQRTTTPKPDATPSAAVPATSKPYEVVRHPTVESMGRDGLRRSITLALKHVGFESAKEEALESFTEMVETYMDGFIHQLKRVAHGARRSDPIPTDYEAALRYHNLPLSSLKPHLKNPVPKRLLEPKFYDPIIENTTRQVRKGGKTLDPEALPQLPKQAYVSIHTRRVTCQGYAKEASRGAGGCPEGRDGSETHRSSG